MKKLLYILVLSVLSCNSNTQKATQDKVEASDSSAEQAAVNNYDLEVLDYDALEPFINKKDNRVHVVNFWATWCAPCVKELPYFEAINKQYNDDVVDVLLVSLDFPKDYKTKLKTFVTTHAITSKVVALDDVNQNRWIPAIDKNWSGALPATIIYKGDKRKFYEQSFTQEELETELKQFLK